MDVVDIAILLLIAMGAVTGFKQGGIHRLTTFIGTILVFAVSWAFKDTLAAFIYEYVPFINFSGEFLGLDSLNILFYELVSFAVIFATLTLILRVLLVVTGLIEKLLKMTIFLAIPSKLLGILIGALEAYFYVFLALIVLNLPFLNLTIIKESKVANFMLNNTLILSNVSEKFVNTYDSVHNIVKNKDNTTQTEINEQIVIIFLENRVISVENLEKLINKNKITINNKNILDKYR